MAHEMFESIGNQLRQARESRSLTIEQASEATYIRRRFLKALEDGNLGEMPSHVQVRGFLRSYADYLGLDSDELLRSLQQPESSPAEEPDQPEAHVSQPDPAQREAEEIFEEIGGVLRQRRELLSLSLKDVEEHTHIPEHYLKLLEAGDFGRFPSPVQSRGMLKNYGSFLGLDSGRLLLRYAEGLQARLAALQPAAPEKRAPIRPSPALSPWLRAVLSADVIFGAFLTVALVAFLIWGVGRISATRAGQQADPTAPSLANVLLPSPSDEPTVTATIAITETLAPAETDEVVVGEGEGGEEAATQEGTVTEVGEVNVELNIVARQRTWMRVVVDGEVAFDGRVIPGAAEEFSASEQIELVTGNAAALHVYYNGRDLGLLGIIGEVVDLVYTQDGIFTPTPTITPTLAPTQLTPAPTPTPTVTPTSAEEFINP